MTTRRSSPPSSQSRRPITNLGSLTVLTLLLLLPTLALRRLTGWVDGRLVTTLPVVISILTYFAYRSDKRRAETGNWRIPERTLHLFELFGGWPGAFLAQRAYRHKTAKLSYQIVFWLIVAAYQLAALDLVSDGKVRSALLQLTKG